MAGERGDGTKTTKGAAGTIGEEKESVYKKRACQRRESLVGAGEVMGAGVAVGAGEVGGAVVTVEAGEVVGAGVTVGAGEVVAAGVAVGAGEVVGAGVAVGAGEVVGAGVAVGAGDVVGVRAVCKTAERRRLPLCLSPSRVLIS